MNSQQASVPPSEVDEAPYVFDESDDLPAAELSHEKPWKLMIVDDDSEIHLQPQYYMAHELIPQTNILQPVLHDSLFHTLEFE